MRMPRVRFTVRWMMVVVAIVAAIVLTAIFLNRRSDEFWGRAAYHQGGEAMSRAVAFRARRLNDDVRLIAHAEQMEAHHRALKLKYERAARHPWLPVAPDPPEPE